MKISYVATDLEFDSTSDLSHIVDELGENVSVHLNEWVENVYRVALGIARRDNHVEESVAFFCSLLERLSDEAKAAWRECSRRVLDIAFESGMEPKCEIYELPAELVHRVSDLGISIAVTIYRAGFYSQES
jgi:hypothetical protein